MKVALQKERADHSALYPLYRRPPIPFPFARTIFTRGCYHRSMRRASLFPMLAAGLLAAAAALPLAAKRAHYIRPVVRSFAAGNLKTIVIENLDGPVTLRTDAGSQVRVAALIHAGGLDETFARTLAEQLR